MIYSTINPYQVVGRIERPLYLVIPKENGMRVMSVRQENECIDPSFANNHSYLLSSIAKDLIECASIFVDNFRSEYEMTKTNLYNMEKCKRSVLTMDLLSSCGKCKTCMKYNILCAALSHYEHMCKLEQECIHIGNKYVGWSDDFSFNEIINDLMSVYWKIKDMFRIYNNILGLYSNTNISYISMIKLSYYDNDEFNNTFTILNIIKSNIK